MTTPAMKPATRSRAVRPRRQQGFTLTELMIALVLGAIVVLAATAMVVTSRGTYRTQDESTRAQESSRFALELVERLVRLAGYSDFGDATAVPAYYSIDTSWNATQNSYALNGPNLVGADNSTASANAVINHSDSLTIRFYGTGAAGVADGNVLDCAGSPVAAPPANAAQYSTNRAFDVLFVDTDPDGEPALKCQRQLFDAAGNAITPVDTQTLIRGVESFQVLYGEANYAVNADPDLVPPISITYRPGVGSANAVVNWSNVVAVRIAMLIRSNSGAQINTAAQTYNLFGTTYPGGSADPGAQFTPPATTYEGTRIRRVVETTIFVRNRLSQWPALN